MVKLFMTNNEIAEALGISASTASTTYTRAFKKVLSECKQRMHNDGLDMTDIEIVILFVKFGWITEFDIPKSVMSRLQESYNETFNIQ